MNFTINEIYRIGHEEPETRPSQMILRGRRLAIKKIDLGEAQLPDREIYLPTIYQRMQLQTETNRNKI